MRLGLQNSEISIKGWARVRLDFLTFLVISTVIYVGC